MDNPENWLLDADFADRALIHQLSRSYNFPDGPVVVPPAWKTFARGVKKVTMGGVVDPTARELTYLVEVLNNTPQLDELDLEGCMMGVVGAKIIAAAVPGFQTNKFNFSGAMFGDAGAMHILDRVAKSLYVISELRIARNLITRASAALIARAISTQALRLLDISGNRLGDAGMQELYAALSMGPGGKLGVLAELNLGGNDIGPAGGGFIAMILSQNNRFRDNQLRRLILSDNPLGSGVNAIMNALVGSAVKWLDISHCKIDPSSAASIANALRRTPLLQGIDLQGNKLGDGIYYIAQAVNAVKNLKILRIGDNAIPSETFKNVMDILGLNTAIDELGMASSGMTDGQLSRLANALTRTEITPVLTTLDLSGNTFSGLLAFSAFVDALKTKNRITVLNLRGNQIGSPGIANLMRAIATRLTIEDLDVDNTGFDNDAMPYIANMIRQNGSVRKLSMRNGAVSDISLLPDALARNVSLEKLYLGGNPLGDPGAILLKGVLEKRGALGTLDIGNCRISAAALAAIALTLRTNRDLTTLNVTGNADSGQVVLVFEAAVAQNDIIREIRGLSTADMHGYVAVHQKLERNRIGWA